MFTLLPASSSSTPRLHPATLRTFQKDRQPCNRHRHVIRRKPLAHLAQRVTLRPQAADRHEVRRKLRTPPCRFLASSEVIYLHTPLPVAPKITIGPACQRFN